MDQTFVEKTYDRLASTYDQIFGPVFNPGRKRVVALMNCQPGDRILEVGVGTGLSLQYYPRDVKVTGIDVSEKMLERARQQIRQHELENADIQTMDAQALSFEDSSFDKVAAMYVASVVPDPKRMVEEMKRVCRPGGDIFIVNHFSREHGLIGGIERVITSITPFIGFRSWFPLDGFLADAKLNVKQIEPVNVFGYWSMIHAVND